jgi:hypothetical protein
MGWRFRKSFSLLPGVRLTLSPRGLSTSVGAGPLRFTVGPQGAAVTARIPGTGIAFRQSIAPSSSTRRSPGITPEPAILPTIPGEPLQVRTINTEEIKSAGTADLTSPGLSAFRDLLTRSLQERRTLLPELATATADAARLQRKMTRWERGWLLRRLFQGRYGRIRVSTTEATDRQSELEEQERLSRLHTQIELPADVRKAYSQFLDSFVLLSKCERKWDDVAKVAADRVRERTTAVQRVDRKPVVFDLGVCDLIESEWKVPRLANANGGDLYLYPGFVLLHISADAFALVDVTEVEIKSATTRFNEEEAVPTDAKIVGQTWKKANKDGSPDRRFANNQQVPVVEYGTLRISSPSGLNEEYLLSNVEAVTHFGLQWNAFKLAFAGATASRPG